MPSSRAIGVRRSSLPAITQVGAASVKCSTSAASAPTPATASGHPQVFTRLRGFMEAGHSITILAGNHDIDLLWPAVAVAQMFAFHASRALGLSPDNPNKQGTVNRVVQGVRLHTAS